MKKKEVIQAWRDGEYYANLSEAERQALPEHPAGLPEVRDEVLSSVTGGCSGKTSGICTPCPPENCF